MASSSQKVHNCSALWKTKQLEMQEMEMLLDFYNPNLASWSDLITDLNSVIQSWWCFMGLVVAREGSLWLNPSSMNNTEDNLNNFPFQRKDLQTNIPFIIDYTAQVTWYQNFNISLRRKSNHQLQIHIKLNLSCDLILYIDVFPSQTGSQNDVLNCLTDLHNSKELLRYDTSTHPPINQPDSSLLNYLNIENSEEISEKLLLTLTDGEGSSDGV